MYLQAERMGVAVNVQPSKPRSCVHQRHRPNADADTIEEWYKVNVALPFMDHIIVELETQFSVLAQTSSKLLGLVPSVMCKKDVDVSIAIRQYVDDLPSPELFDQEFSRWQHKYATKADSVRPASCAQALRTVTKISFPMYTLFYR